MRYLRAIGLDPRHVVIQRGSRNYAGPKCPGGKWSCTKARRVLQIGTDNLYTCSPKQSGTAPNTCAIVQPNGGTATCEETSAGAVPQSCSITQGSPSSANANQAKVTQTLGQFGQGSGTQNATQNVSIAQTSGGGANTISVTQTLAQALGRGSDQSDEGDNDADDFTPLVSSPIVQTQNAHQNIDVRQTSGSGANASTVFQFQLQVERADHAPKITQAQNTTLQTNTGPCTVFDPTKDEPTANQCYAVQQNSTSGANNVQVRQSYNQLQAASNCCAAMQGSQVQGVANKGGVDHRFQQTSSGKSTQSSNQIERQIQRRALIGAAGIAHESHGPIGIGLAPGAHPGKAAGRSLQNRKGTGLQTGNNGDTATQTQTSTQISTPASPGNDTNILSDNCVSDGTCSGAQSATHGGVTTTNSGSASGGQALALVISCNPNCATPPPGSIVIPAGTSQSQTTAVNVPAQPPKADIEFAIDTTGSMGASIAQARTDATNIVNGVKAQIADSEFAVVAFKDASDGTAEYAVPQSMTSDASAVQTAVNGLSASGGGDTPEAYNLVYHNSYTPDTLGDIGWRAGTRKFVIVIGDAEPHGAGSAGFAGCSDTSSDPHGFNTATELAGMNTAKRTLFMILQTSTASTTLQCYQSLAAAAFTGGQGVAGGADLASQIVSLINAATQTVSDVHLEVASATPAPAAASWVSFAPPAYSNVTPPVSESFTETVNVPAGTPSGTYTFDIKAVADGVDLGHHTITVFVP